MKITRRQLRRIIREGLTEGTLYVTQGPYGPNIEDDQGKGITIGTMVAELFDAGDDDIFQAPQGVDPRARDTIINKWEQLHPHNPIDGWDPDVFEDYYNVDLDRVIRLYARLRNHNIEETPLELDEGA